MSNCSCQICGGSTYPASAEITGRPLCQKHYHALNMQLTHASLRATQKVHVYKCKSRDDVKKVLIAARNHQIRAYQI